VLIEFLVDKVPAVDTINDGIQTFIRPAAGAILFAASAGVISEAHPVVALICGLLVAGGVHAAKATARPIITGTTGGLLNPVVSFFEDALSIIVTVLLLLLLLVLIVWFIRWRRRRRAWSSPKDW
jgi:fucose permease